MKFTQWDFIVVGTGMGSGPIGLKLAEAGYSVLFLEKGSPVQLKGKFAEEFQNESPSMSQTEALKKSGRWSEAIQFKNPSGKSQEKIPFIGSGVGGSSALYGMVLERFSAEDVSKWPIDFNELQRHYSTAEKLLGVNSSAIRNPVNQDLARQFSEKNVATYSLPMAQKRDLTCGKCQGKICECGCKLHAGNAFIEKALKYEKVELLTDCQVLRVLHKDQRAVGVEVKINQQIVLIEGRQIILAAGALVTPTILDRSKIGLESGQLGRNLMRHFVDLYAVKAPKSLRKAHRASATSKEMGIKISNSFTLQSFGELPPAVVIANDLWNSLRATFGSSFLGQWIDRLQVRRPLMQVLKMVGRMVRQDRVVLASIIEDVPQFENRVWMEGEKMQIQYSISDSEKNKIRDSRSQIQKALKGRQVMTIESAEKNEMLAHACGTARMGTDPQSSVVDPTNRVHGIENVYVTDASFFPTSGKTNPGLTIAANSLRVAEIILNNIRRNVEMSGEVSVWEEKN